METEVQGNGQGKIYGLIAQIMKQVNPIAKSRTNEQQNYKFRGIDDVYAAVHPLFAEHGVFTIPRILAENTTERTTASGTILRFVNVSVAYDFFAPDGSHVTAEVIGEAMDSGDKASNKAMSAAHKYALIQTLCIPTGSTPDADFTTQPEITGEARQVSRSNTAPQKCPDCNGAMWDNRETKKGNQPDFKCKSKSCNRAVWLPKEPITEGYSEDQILRDQYFAQAEKLLSGVEEDRRKEALGRLLMLSTEDMGKKVLELAENAKKKKPAPGEDDERLRLIEKIEDEIDEDQITKYMAEHYEGLHLSELSLEVLNKLYSDLYIPF